MAIANFTLTANNQFRDINLSNTLISSKGFNGIFFHIYGNFGGGAIKFYYLDKLSANMVPMLVGDTQIQINNARMVGPTDGFPREGILRMIIEGAISPNVTINLVGAKNNIVII